jgi:preprotein translocase SecE subunit
VARDRQRAKQRKARRAGQNPGPASSEPHRANVPGELEHASGEADEFDAALVAGAGASGRDIAPPDDAVPADDSADATEDEELIEDALEADPAATGEIYDDELEDLDEDDDAEVAPAGGGVATRRGRSGAESATPAGAAAPSRGVFARFAAFLRASWAELQRVQWPDRRQVAQATAVVLGFVVVAGLYLGVADRVAQEVVDFII